MTKIKRAIRLAFAAMLLLPLAAGAQDRTLDVLRDELQRQKSELDRQQEKPYYMNFRIDDNVYNSVSASFGALQSSGSDHSARFMSQIRLGDPQFDSYLGGQAYQVATMVPPAVVPMDGESGEQALRQAIWRDVNTRYKLATQYFESVKASAGVIAQGQDSAPNFTPAQAEKYYDPEFTDEQLAFDRAYWEERMREYSAIPLRDGSITESSAHINYNLNRKYFVDTDGTEIIQNLTYCTMSVQAVTMADDGMELPLYKVYFAFTPDGLPSPEQVADHTEALTDKLIALREAPIVQAYTGPALLSGDASGVFFHEIFGHRIEGQPMKNNTDGQTFKKLVGQYVLPASMSVYDDPTARTYQGRDLNGFFKFDEQGVRGERVDVVADGIMSDFLMTRTAIEGFGQTNGHARAQMGYDPTSRQSNLIIETSDPRSEAELRELLLAEVRAQGREYGFFFKQVTGGFTMTSAASTNSFQVNPLEVYRIYPDGRPDELVRGVDLIGTPLSMFSNIEYAGGDSKIFTGTCGATSGNVPVTAISPMIMVNKIEVQRKPAPRAIPQILPRP